MFILLPVVILVSSASTICLLSYCKSRNLKKQQSQVNHVTRRRLGARQPVPSIYIVPTTSQIMEMYANQAINNAGQSRTTTNEQFKPPPDYGQVVVEIPPTYEEAININRAGRSIANQT
ncbi:uncharacterized protein LOC129906965 isoform X1 [Episyrphus balteatus]|uniref:uncharacterized protein LOC129906965 isoform X1 n=1 Tax=Episyrphus balteatus TaxID=286459 RepID=UPI0024859F5F|nr:uncharacterized protein LOC129906965 isoform X1 [Episyrphus balteatus]